MKINKPVIPRDKNRVAVIPRKKGAHTDRKKAENKTLCRKKVEREKNL